MQVKGGTGTSSIYGESSYSGWTCLHEVSEYRDRRITEPALTHDNASACKCK